MFKLTLIVVLVAFLFVSCKKENEPATTSGTNGAGNLYSIGPCGDFFNQGDYSSVCFIDTQLPDDTLMYSVDNEFVRMCHYFLIEEWGVSEDGISVKIHEFSNVASAKNLFDQGQQNYPGGTVISDVGDEGYYVTDPGVGDPYGIRIGNVVILLDDNPTGGPNNASCTDFMHECALLVNEMINNLN